MEERQAGRIASVLEDWILSGRFKDGERLDETTLAREFDVSRTPVREALQHLVVSELARQLPRRGVFVQRPDPITLAEMFETMAEIEGTCGKLAARRITVDEIEILRTAHRACEKAVAAHDAAAYARCNEVFHHIIYRNAGNAFLEQQATRLFRLLKPFRRLQFQTHGRMAASLTEHVALLNALTSGDCDTAATVARAHVAAQAHRYHEQVAALRDPHGIRSVS